MIQRCLLAVLLLGMTACVSVQLPRPRELTLPEARYDSNGRYLSPYTSDGVLAEWTDEAVRVKAAGDIVGAFGTLLAIGAGGVPVLASAARRVGSDIGRRQALEAVGGWDRIRASSDVSFDSVDDLAVYLYAYYSAERSYVDALDAAMTIYPELKERYLPAIENARK